MENNQESSSSANTPLDLLTNKTHEPAFVQSEEGKAAQRKYGLSLLNDGRVDNPQTIEDFIKNLNKSHYKKPQRRKQVTDVETGLKLFHAIASTFTSDSTQKKFVYNEHNKVLIQDMVKWFIADPTGPLDVDKGIMLCGHHGIGKTHLFRLFNAMVNSYNDKNHLFKTFICVGMYEDIKNKKTKVNDYVTGHAFFDDLGYETQTADTVVKDYGNVSSPINEVIFHRERKWELTRQITHFTTNLSPDGLKARYGDRTFDRLKNLCNFIYNAQPYSFR